MDVEGKELIKIEKTTSMRGENTSISNIIFCECMK